MLLTSIVAMATKNSDVTTANTVKFRWVTNLRMLSSCFGELIQFQLR